MWLILPLWPSLGPASAEPEFGHVEPMAFEFSANSHPISVPVLEAAAMLLLVLDCFGAWQRYTFLCFSYSETYLGFEMSFGPIECLNLEPSLRDTFHASKETFPKATLAPETTDVCGSNAFMFVTALYQELLVQLV